MRRSFLFSVVITLGLALGAWFAWPGAGGSVRAALVPTPSAQASSPGAEPLRAIDGAVAIAAAATSAPRTAAETFAGATGVESVGASLDVIVLNERNGAPVPGVRVEVSVVETLGRSLESYFEAAFAHTDGLGRALVDVPAGEPLEVRVSNQGSGLRLRPLAEGAKEQVVLRVPVAQERVFHGRVVAASDGLPIGGAQIVLLGSDLSLQRADDEDTPLGEVVASTDGDGRFVFRETSLRPSQLAVRAPHHDLLVFRADEGHGTPDRERVLELLQFARLVVAIPDAHGEQVGLVLQAYTVRAEERHGALGPDGRCTFENVWPHTAIDVELLRSNGTIRRIPAALTLEPGEIREIKWTLGGTRVHGSVARADGAPLNDAEVWLLEPFGTEGDRRRPLYRDDDELLVARAELTGPGTFEFRDVAAGTYWVGVPPTVFGAREYSLAHLIHVTGDGPDIRVDLEVLTGAFLAGRVQTKEGAPCDGANVYAATDPTGFRTSGQADREGRFRLGPMPSGTYELTARRRGGAPSRPVRASTGEQDVVLELRAAATVRGQVSDASTGRLERAQYGIYSADAFPLTGEALHGTFEHELEPGAYTLVAATEDGRVSCPLAFDLADGQDLAGLEARLETGGRLRIRSSLPVSWARVRWNGSIVAETVAGPERLLVLPLPLGDVTIELHDGSQVLAMSRATVELDAVAEVVLGP